MRRRDFIRLGARLGTGLAAIYAAGPTAASAQSYPARPVKLVVPYPPGGVVDVVARHWAEKAGSIIGGSFVVENQAGGGGTLGAGAVKRASADGHTLLFGETSCLIIAPYLSAQPPYDPQKDFSAISLVATSSTSIIVHPSMPVKNLAEFITYAKANQEQLSYGSAGAGTVTHLAGELFKQLIGAPKITHVPYRGAGPAMVDAVAGVIPMSTPNINGQILQMHNEGKLRILAVCAPERLKAAPDIPTAAETVPGLVLQLTSGVLAPAGTPDDIVAKLSAATAKVIADPDFQRILATSGLEGRADSTAATAKAFWQSERQRLTPVMTAAGLTPS